MERSNQNRLLAQDRQFIWHPFTQMKDYAAEDHVLLERAEGMHLYDADGNAYYDTVSSWWVNVHGHAHPKIQEAIREQMTQLDHVMFSGFTHQPAIELAAKLVELTPAGLDKVFYSDNGSTAVEVALKMSFQYWRHVGKPEKSRFVYLENSYHGDTLGAVSVGGVELFHSTFRPLLFNAFRAASPNPAAWRTAHGLSEAEAVERCLQELRELFERSAGEIAGVIIEPLVQAAGGMIIYPADYLRGLRALCDEFEVHVIADEVAVGFGRTGRMFACEHAGITPDMLCLSKGITAGVMPLAVTLCTNMIYDAFYDDYATMKTFFHGHSFTGNPVACAVALANLRIFEEERTLERSVEVSAHLQRRFAEFGTLAHVANIRGIGHIAALDLLADKGTDTPFPSEKRMGFQVYKTGLKHGIIMRPLGDTVYWWLPLIVTCELVDDIHARALAVFHELGLA